MFDQSKKIAPDKLEPSTEYFLSDGTTTVLVRTCNTGRKFTIQPSRVLGMISLDKCITFDIPYLVSSKFVTGCTSFYCTEGVVS